MNGAGIVLGSPPVALSALQVGAVDLLGVAVVVVVFCERAPVRHGDSDGLGVLATLTSSSSGRDASQLFEFRHCHSRDLRVLQCRLGKGDVGPVMNTSWGSVVS